MKTIKKTMYVVMVFTAILFTACSTNDDDNNDDDDGGNSGGAEFVTAKIDGVAFEAAQDPAVIVGATSGNNLLTFQGGTNQGNTLRGSIFNYNGAGTYTTGDGITNVNSLSYITLPANMWTSTFDIGTGTLTVTQMMEQQ